MYVMQAWTVKHSIDWLSGLQKAITSFVSIFAAIKLISLLPKPSTWISCCQLQTVNTDLLTEVAEHKPTNKPLREILDVTKQQRAIATNQKQIDQEQLVSQLEQLNALKDNFLNTVSHELRTPLCNIMMTAQILQTINTDEQTQRYLEILQVECDHELQLINNLLDLQRIEAATTPQVTPEPLVLEYWLHSITEPFFIRTQEQQQTLQFDLPPDIPPLVSDNTSLARILIELLNNACKYTNAGGKILLSVSYEESQVSPSNKNNQRQERKKLTVPYDAKQVNWLGSGNPCFIATLDPYKSNIATKGKPSKGIWHQFSSFKTRPAGTYCPSNVYNVYNLKNLSRQADSSPTSWTVFTISNSSEIPRAALPRIFDKFYRVSQPHNSKQNGSGLGLALVQKLVGQLQGSIEVESDAGWTTFTLKFRDLVPDS
jgi:signal transduction histidine kinase